MCDSHNEQHTLVDLNGKSACVCIQHNIAFIVSVEHHVDMAEYVGGILYSFTYLGYGTTHITAYASDFCMSPCHIDFRISLKKSFVLANFIGSYREIAIAIESEAGDSLT